MESRAALGAAAALALTVTGGVSALFLTMGQASGSSSEPSVADAAVTIEYVDENGNPVDAPAMTATTPEIVLVNPDGTIVNQASATAADPAGTAAYGSEAYAEEEYEEEEYEEGEQEEEEYEEEEYEEGEHEEDAEEYAAGGHHEDEDEEGYEHD